jgi:uncharacterized protein (TIGR02246 family)
MKIKSVFHYSCSNSFSRLSGSTVAISTLSLLLILILASSGKAQAKSDAGSPDASSSDAMAEARRAIDKGNAQWIAAWAKGDPAMVADIFSEDGSMLAGNGKIIKGRQQILERQKAVMQSVGPGVKVTVETVRVWLDGDTAYETGKYRYQYQEKGKPATDEGRYVTVWKRQKDGSWKLFVDMAVPQD